MAKRFSDQRAQIMRDYYGDDGPGGLAAQSAADAVEDARQRNAENEAAALTGTGSVFDVAAEKVDDVKAYAAAHPDELERLLDDENARGDDARTTLVSFLENAIEDRDAADDDDGDD